jgi:predicted ferric reductase
MQPDGSLHSASTTSRDLPGLNMASSAVTSSALTEALPVRAGAAGRRLALLAIWLFVAGNTAGILWIWGAGGADGLGYHWHGLDTALVGVGRLTALLGGYLALVEVLLLARLPFLERAVGFDRLTVWHRRNGFLVIALVLAHVVFSVWGYAIQDRNSFLTEYWNWLTLPQPGSATISGGIGGSISAHPASVALAPTSPYPGVITATVGTALLVAVVATSVVAVRRKLSYEWWYAIHFTVYAAIALSWFHMIPDGNELVIDRIAADYWRGLFALTLALVLYFRLARPLVQGARLDLRVTSVVREAPGVVSLRIGGRGLDRLGARPGQFFLWRFLTRGFWYTKHPFSLSEAPNGESFRITVKALGDHSSQLGEIPVGTRVLAEGPFGVFTAESSRTAKALLIAGGIGITPVRALLERMAGDIVVVYRVVAKDDIVFAGELDRIAARHGARIEYAVGDHTSREGRDLLSRAHLESLVPDLTDRDVFVCGPPGMIDRIVPSLRAAGVPRDQLHIERFAL